MLLDLQTAKKALTNVSANAPADARFQLRIKNKSGFSITIPQLKFPSFLEPGNYEFAADQTNTLGEFVEVLNAELIIEAIEEPTIKTNIEQPQYFQLPPQQPQQTNEMVSPAFILKLLEKDQAAFQYERKLHDDKISTLMQSNLSEINRLREAHQKEISTLKELHAIEISNLKTLNDRIDAERDKIKESVERQLRGERKEQAKAGKRTIWDIIGDFVEKNPDEILAFIQSRDGGNNTQYSQTQNRPSNLQDAIKEAREAGL